MIVLFNNQILELTENNINYVIDISIDHNGFYELESDVLRVGYLTHQDKMTDLAEWFL